jgi:nicotinamidase-related amidase
MSISLPVRFYCPLPSDNAQGYVTETWDLDLEKTAFVSLHCWNVGCPGGPPVPTEFWVDMGSLQNHEVGWQVIQEQIVPALETARRLGMTIVHVQPEMIGKKYSHLQPPLIEESSPSKVWTGPVSDHYSRRANRVHGEGFNNWEGWKELDFAAPTRPLENETVIVTTPQWDAWLREKGIDTLIYVGFCTNLCILDAPGGMRLMAPLGYRCIILREATLAVEFPDTLEQRLNTQTSLRFIEAWVGYTASSEDFFKAGTTAE